MDVAWNTEASVTDGNGKGCDQFQNNDSTAGFFSYRPRPPRSVERTVGKHTITDLRPTQLPHWWTWQRSLLRREVKVQLVVKYSAAVKLRLLSGLLIYPLI